jgi:adenylate kinase family enzyme
MSQIFIAGVPRAGKTTFGRQLAATLDVALRSTDDLIATHGWSEASAEVAKWFNAPDGQVIEGVAVPRALRKWLAAYPGRPADAVVWMPSPRLTLSEGQETMSRGCSTVFEEVRPELVKRGVRVVELHTGG